MNGAIARRLAWALVLIQGAHVAEHVTQTVQVYVLHMPRGHAHGLLGALFDFEWVHFAYNTAFLAALAVVFRLHGRALRNQARGPVWSLFVAGLVLQCYHELEHVVKIYQHVALGKTPAPGILGNLVDLVMLHLAFNAIVYLAVLPLLVQSLRARPVGRSPVARTGGRVRAEQPVG